MHSCIWNLAQLMKSLRLQTRGLHGAGFLTAWQPQGSHTSDLVTEIQEHCLGKQNRATLVFVVWVFL